MYMKIIKYRFIQFSQFYFINKVHDHHMKLICLINRKFSKFFFNNDLKCSVHRMYTFESIDTLIVKHVCL